MAVNATTINVTPQMAEQWLDGHDNYREISRRHVEYLANEMIGGRWQMTGEPIVFNGNGTLLDGQHRLAAVVKSGVTVPMLMVTGIRRAALPVMDQGKSRTMRDVLRATTNCAKPTQWASALRTIGLWAGWLPAASRIPPHHLMAIHDVVNCHGDLNAAVSTARASVARDVCVAGISEAATVVCVWMARQDDATHAADWVNRLLEMEPPPGKGDPEFAVHRAVMRARQGSTLPAKQTASLLWQSFLDRKAGRSRKLYRIGNDWPEDGSRLLTEILGKRPWR